MLRAVIICLDSSNTGIAGLDSFAGNPEIAHICRLIRELYEKGFLIAVVSDSSAEDPDLFVTAAEKLGARPSETLVIADTQSGVSAARKAGAACMGYSNPYSGNEDLSGAAILVEGFEEVDAHFLTQVWERFAGQPLTILSTDRLIIRELTMDDFDALYCLNQKPEISPALLYPISGKRMEREKLRSYINTVYSFYGYGYFGVFLKKNGRLIGISGLEPVTSAGTARIELGYYIDPDFQRRGYGYECVLGLLESAWDRFGIDEVYARIEPDNTASLQLAKKLGLVECGSEDGKLLLKIRLKGRM